MFHLTRAAHLGLIHGFPNRKVWHCRACLLAGTYLDLSSYENSGIYFSKNTLHLRKWSFYSLLPKGLPRNLFDSTSGPPFTSLKIANVNPENPHRCFITLNHGLTSRRPQQRKDRGKIGQVIPGDAHDCGWWRLARARGGIRDACSPREAAIIEKAISGMTTMSSLKLACRIRTFSVSGSHSWIKST